MNLGGISLSASAIFTGVIFGAAGFYFFRRAKGDGNLKGMLVGVALMVYPYFGMGDLALWVVGVALFALAWRWRDD